MARSKSGPHTYRGHRRASFVADDLPELVEFRARQRTFHGAYGRTALGNLGYALTILRLFDRRFYKIGLLFAILSGLLFVLSLLRSRHSNHDFADQIEASSPPAEQTSVGSESTTGSGGEHEEEGDQCEIEEVEEEEEAEEEEEECSIRTKADKVEGDDMVSKRTSSPATSTSPSTRASGSRRRMKKKVKIVCTAGQENTRVFGRPFITAGWIVLAVAGVVAAVEIGLLVLIFKV